MRRGLNKSELFLKFSFHTVYRELFDLGIDFPTAAELKSIKEIHVNTEIICL